jgi:hypothetical protein
MKSPSNGKDLTPEALLGATPFVRRPGDLDAFETRGFASPDHSGFAFVGKRSSAVNGLCDLVCGDSWAVGRIMPRGTAGFSQFTTMS